MLTAVMKGQSMIEGARSQKLLNDIKNVEAVIGQYSNQKGRLPGDCNRDGIVDFNLATLQTLSATAYDTTVTSQTARASLYDYSGGELSSATATAATGDLSFCADVGTSATVAENNANRWVNDLRNANVINRSTTNRLFTKHVAEDFMYVGKWISANTEEFNAITVANVPVAMAKRVLSNINGSEVNSDSGQIRVIDKAGAVVTSSAFAALANNEVVNLIYFYRNQPVALGTATTGS